MSGAILFRIQVGTLTFIDGKKAVTLCGSTISADFKQIVIDYIEKRYGQGQKAAE